MIRDTPVPGTDRISDDIEVVDSILCFCKLFTNLLIYLLVSIIVSMYISIIWKCLEFYFIWHVDDVLNEVSDNRKILNFPGISGTLVCRSKKSIPSYLFTRFQCMSINRYLVLFFGLEDWKFCPWWD